jgi:hypothetical protein
MNRRFEVLIKQHTDEPHPLFNGVRSTVNSVCCHQVRSTSGRSVHGPCTNSWTLLDPFPPCQQAKKMPKVLGCAQIIYLLNTEQNCGWAIDSASGSSVDYTRGGRLSTAHSHLDNVFNAFLDCLENQERHLRCRSLISYFFLSPTSFTKWQLRER